MHAHNLDSDMPSLVSGSLNFFHGVYLVFRVLVGPVSGASGFLIMCITGGDEWPLFHGASAGFVALIF